MGRPTSQLFGLSGPGEETDTLQLLHPPSPQRTANSRTWAAWERAVAVNTAAVLVVLGLFLWMVFRSINGTNTAGLQMPAMNLQHRVSYWWPFLMGETLGIAALVWSYLSVLVGLLFSTRRPRWLGLNRRQINDLHRQLSLTTIALILGHAFFVAVGGMNDAMTARAVSFTQAFLPFQTSWDQWPYAFGIFSLYLALLLGPTYYLRNRLGARAWKIVHRLSLAVYILAVVHTIYFDDFDFHGPYRLALWVAQIPLAAMLLWRLAAPVSSAGHRKKARLDPGGAPTALLITRDVATRLVVGAAAAAVSAGMVIIVATGHIGGTPSPFHHTPTTSPTPHDTNKPITPRLNTPGMNMGS